MGSPAAVLHLAGRGAAGHPPQKTLCAPHHQVVSSSLPESAPATLRIGSAVGNRALPPSHTWPQLCSGVGRQTVPTARKSLNRLTA